jgi:hypothetical protein
MERKTQTGYLMLADISGYTSFVAKTEIEHADLALSFLLEVMVEAGRVTIGQLEGMRSLLHREGKNTGRQIPAGIDRSDVPGVSG